MIPIADTAIIVFDITTSREPKVPRINWSRAEMGKDITLCVKIRL